VEGDLPAAFVGGWPGFSSWLLGKSFYHAEGGNPKKTLNPWSCKRYMKDSKINVICQEKSVGGS